MKAGKELTYTELYHLLNNTLSGHEPEQWLKENDVNLWVNSFHSVSTLDEDMFFHSSTYDVFFDPETAKKYNENFNYPVFVPDSDKARKECIILLHGLNERNWDKYLPWAYTLAKQTGKSVILFPIAYHMDRSPEQWKDPRKMLPYVKKRRMELPNVNMSTVVNVALSERLTAQPERLFFSGYQAAGDVMKLMDSITSGEHPLFEKGTVIDFFSYSIGTFLTQIMMLGNPGNRFDNSKFLFFCGGSAFDDMYGVSRYILDSEAYVTLKDYYSNTFENDLNRNSGWKQVFNSTAIGDSFRAMLSLKSLRHYRSGLFSKFRDRLMTITLRQDKVIIPEKANSVLSGTRVEEMDFNYAYIHENPFPVSDKPSLRNEVNSAFESFIGKVVPFFV